MGRADGGFGVTSRRQFFRAGAAGGIALTLTRLALAEEPSFASRETLPGRQRWNPAAGGRGVVSRLATSDLRKPHRPSVSPSRTCRRNVLSAHFSKSMSSDTAMTISAVCTKARNIRWNAVHDHDRQDGRA